MIEHDKLVDELRAIAGIAGACRVQRIPSDDAIIAGHIEEIERRALAVLQLVRDAATEARDAVWRERETREAASP